MINAFEFRSVTDHDIFINRTDKQEINIKIHAKNRYDGPLATGFIQPEAPGVKFFMSSRLKHNILRPINPFAEKINPPINIRTYTPHNHTSLGDLI